MCLRLRNNEDGYSLVEVMVSIMILAIAILPMMSMFDAGLRASSLGSNYDTARALANEKLEEIKALPFRDPGTPSVADSILEKYRPVNEPATAQGGLGPGSPVSGTRGGFSYTVTTTYVQEDFEEPPDSATKIRRSFIKVTVQVSWQGKSTTITGIRVVNV